jgi:hypothetical protein
MTTAAAAMRLSSPFRVQTLLPPRHSTIPLRRGPGRAGLAVSAAAAAGSPATVLVTGAGGRTGRQHPASFAFFSFASPTLLYSGAAAWEDWPAESAHLRQFLEIKTHHHRFTLPICIP